MVNKTMLEKVQARATKLIPSLKDLPYQDRISRLNLTTLEDREGEEATLHEKSVL